MDCPLKTWAKAHPYEAEPQKSAEQSGKYWHPEAYQLPATMKIGQEPGTASAPLKQ